jgi:hypothetical protein
MIKLAINKHGLYESKQSLVDVWDLEDRIHRSVIVPDTDGNSKVLSYEQIPANYPEWSFLVFESLEEYYEAIKDVDWIMDEVTDNDLENLKELIEEEN